MKKVNVIMSVYNGEKYLREQLESLLNQTYPCNIYIHDDGSKDNSMNILKEYDGVWRNGSRIEVLSDKAGLGYPDCFFIPLLNSCNADYYSFCDQDDVWHPDKIKNAVKALEGNDSCIPTLVYSAVTYCDAELNPGRTSEYAKGFKDKITKVSPHRLVYSGEALGMTFVFNEALRMHIRKAYNKGFNKYKDEFIKKLAASIGNVYYISEPMVLYRRHETAVSGGYNSTSLLQRYFRLLKKYLSDVDDKNEDYEIFQYIFENERKNIADIKMLKLIWSFRDNGVLIRLFWPQRFRYKFVDEIAIRLFIALGRR